MKRLLGLFLILISLSFAQNINFTPIGHINDFANMLSEQTVNGLNQKLTFYKEQTGIEIVLVTVKSLDGYPIETYTIKLANKWGIGTKGVDDGLVILIAPNERKWRFEVGYGLEAYLTDAECSTIGRKYLTERFKLGEYEQGIDGCIDAVLLNLGKTTREQRVERAIALQQQREKEERETKEAMMSALFYIGIILITGIILFVIYILFKKISEHRKKISELKRRKNNLLNSISESIKNADGKIMYYRKFDKFYQLKSRIDKIHTIMNDLYKLKTDIKPLKVDLHLNIDKYESDYNVLEISIKRFVKHCEDHINNRKEILDYESDVNSLSKNKSIDDARRMIDKIKSRFDNSIWDGNNPDIIVGKLNETLQFITKNYDMAKQKALSYDIDGAKISFDKTKSLIQEYINLSNYPDRVVGNANNMLLKIQQIKNMQQEFISKAQNLLSRNHVTSSTKKLFDTLKSKIHEFNQNIHQVNISEQFILAMAVINTLRLIESKSDSDISQYQYEQRRKREEEEEEERRRRRSSYNSSYSSYSSSGGSSSGGGISIGGGGSFGGGGASGGW